MLNAIAKPFGVLLMFLYDLVQNYGVSIILFALVIKVILLPFQMKSKRGMMRQQRLQPKIAELQKKHGTNKQKINEEMAKLYKEEGVNPASGCLWGFLPLPIMLALFQVIRQPLTIMMGVAEELLSAPSEALPLGGGIYQILENLGFTSSVREFYLQIAQSQFISTHFDKFEGLFENLRRINFNFIGIDLGLTPSWQFLWNNELEVYGTWLAGFALFLIPILSGGVQFLASALNKKLNPVPTPEGGGGGSMQAMMMLMPLFSIYIAFITPGALGFYWTISTVFQLVQDIFLTKIYTKKIDAEEAIKNEARALKEAEIEAKRIETERKKAEGLIERNPNTSKRKKQKSDKQGQIDKASEWSKKNAPEGEDEKYEPSRVGNRRYARGRAYDPDRYAGAGSGDTDDDERDSAALIGRGDTDDDEDRDASGSDEYDGEETAGDDDEYGYDDPDDEDGDWDDDEDDYDDDDEDDDEDDDWDDDYEDGDESGADDAGADADEPETTGPEADGKSPDNGDEEDSMTTPLFETKRFDDNKRFDDDK